MKFQRAAKALDVLEQNWRQAEAASPGGAWRLDNAKKLAAEFRWQMQAHPDLIGRRVNSNWIRPRYPLFCQSLGIHWKPQPYKDFARELAYLMPRERREKWHAGKRDTFTFYLVPDPDAAVVALSQEKRKRA